MGLQSSGGLVGLVCALLAAVLLVLGFQSFQLHNLEERAIAQARQLRELGASSDRLTARIDSLARGGVRVATGGAGAPVDEYADVPVLHPERPNLLARDTFSYANPDVPQDRTLHRGWDSGDPKGFNTLIENEADLAHKLEHYTMEGLGGVARWTDPLLNVQGLAWRVEGNDDQTEFVIYLRRGVKWHRPSGVDLSDERYAWLRGEHELTARDVVFGLDMLMNPQVENGAIKSFYGELESWEALDDYTLRVRWKKSLYFNLSLSIGAPVIPEFLWAYDETGERFPDETIGLRFNQHWYASKGMVGTGPYRMAEYQPGVSITLERNEDYWGEKPPIARIVYSIYSDPERTLLMLKSHELHAGDLRPGQYRNEILRWKDVPPEQRPDTPFTNGDIQCTKQLDFAYYYLGWNADRPIFSDSRVRHAMTLAFNRRQIIDDIYVGLAEIAPGPFLSTSPFNDPEVPIEPFDLERAGALLAEAGWVDSDGDGLLDRDLDGDGKREPFEFSLLLFAHSTETMALANVLKDDLSKLGVRMRVDAAEWSLMQKKMDEKQFDATAAGWAVGWESDPYQIWHSSQADEPKGSNRIGFRDPEVDQLIVDLRATFDRDERIRMYRRIHRRIADAHAVSFFRVPYTVFCWWSDVKGVQFPKTRPLIDTFPWWIEER